MTTHTIHTFEAAGLGVAPFTFLYEIDRGRSHTSCDYCGTGIRYEQVIRDANGKVFKVGNECVRKTGDRGLIDLIKKAERERKAEQKRAKLEAELQAQRERNGGKTDQELFIEAKLQKEAEEKARLEAEKEAHRAEIRAINSRLLEAMKPMINNTVNYRNQQATDWDLEWRCSHNQPFRDGTFMGSVWEQLKDKPYTELSSRQREVLAEIVAKGNMRAAGKRKIDTFLTEMRQILQIEA